MCSKPTLELRPVHNILGGLLAADITAQLAPHRNKTPRSARNLTLKSRPAVNIYDQLAASVNCTSIARCRETLTSVPNLPSNSNQALGSFLAAWWLWWRQVLHSRHTSAVRSACCPSLSPTVISGGSDGRLVSYSIETASVQWEQLLRVSKSYHPLVREMKGGRCRE